MNALGHNIKLKRAFIRFFFVVLPNITDPHHIFHDLDSRGEFLVAQAIFQPRGWKTNFAWCLETPNRIFAFDQGHCKVNKAIKQARFTLEDDAFILRTLSHEVNGVWVGNLVDLKLRDLVGLWVATGL